MSISDDGFRVLLEHDERMAANTTISFSMQPKAQTTTTTPSTPTIAPKHQHRFPYHPKTYQRYPFIPGKVRYPHHINPNLATLPTHPTVAIQVVLSIHTSHTQIIQDIQNTFFRRTSMFLIALFHVKQNHHHHHQQQNHHRYTSTSLLLITQRHINVILLFLVMSAIQIILRSTNTVIRSIHF